jgi:hypothetical protein
MQSYYLLALTHISLFRKCLINLGNNDVEDLTAEGDDGEDASKESRVLEEGEILCFKMAHGEIARRVGKM